MVCILSLQDLDQLSSAYVDVNQEARGVIGEHSYSTLCLVQDYHVVAHGSEMSLIGAACPSGPVGPLWKKAKGRAPRTGALLFV